MNGVCLLQAVAFPVGCLLLLLLSCSPDNVEEKSVRPSASPDSFPSSTTIQIERSSLTPGEKRILQAIAARHPDFNYTENILRYRESSGRTLFSEVVFERDSSGLYFGIYPIYEVLIDEFTGIVRERMSVGAMVHEVRSFMVIGDSVEMMEWQSGTGGNLQFKHFRNGRLQREYAKRGEELKFGK